MSDAPRPSDAGLPPRVRRLVWAALLTLGIGLAALAFVTYRYAAPVAANAERFALGPRAESSATLQRLWQVPGFALRDQHGAEVSPRQLAGHVWIADFMFTTCTSVCPLITSKLVLLQHQLTDPTLRFVSFSVDPERDTAAALLRYAEAWNRDESRWLLLQTEPRSLAALASGMRVAVDATNDLANPILHSKMFFLVDGSGSVRGVYDSDDNEALDRLRQDARKLAGDSAARGESDGLPQSGAALFQVAGCAGCHDNPKVAPDLRGLFGSSVELAGGGKAAADAAYLRESMTAPAAKLVAGYLNLMPSYQEQLSTQQLDALVDYLVTLAVEPGVTPLPAPSAEASARSAKVARPLQAKVAPTASAAPSVAEPSPPAVPPIAVDPVCGMSVRTAGDESSVTFEGRRYFFCSDTCRQHFSADPSKVLSHPPTPMQ